jgi:hypothetical protein
VAIDPGQHTIDFRFEPVSHLLGAAISALLLLLALALLLGGLYAQRRARRLRRTGRDNDAHGLAT